MPVHRICRHSIGFTYNEALEDGRMLRAPNNLPDQYYSNPRVLSFCQDHNYWSSTERINMIGCKYRQGSFGPGFGPPCKGNYPGFHQRSFRGGGGRSTQFVLEMCNVKKIDLKLVEFCFLVHFKLKIYLISQVYNDKIVYF